MRTSGKVTFWKDDAGFGFITPSSGAKQVFVHIRAFGKDAARPAVDERVTFVLSSDKQGRPCAVRVARFGDNNPDSIKRNDGVLLIFLAAMFFIVAGVAVAVTGASWLIPIAYGVLSVVTFLVYALDKSAARRGGQRTSEANLHLLALLGGWPGAMIAQQALRHKSIKQPFRLTFWVTVAINCGVFIWLLTPAGTTLLQQILG